MDKVVFDIETKNTFGDVGGYHNLLKLDISFVGAYSYKHDKYFSFFEKDLETMAPLLQSAGLLIGFSSNRFDIPVLDKYFNFNLKAIESLDMLEDIEEKLGHRIGLGILAQTNLGIGKTGHGLDAITYYKEGRMDELEKYCLQDVKITKDLYELGKKQGYLMVPTNYGNSVEKVELDWHARMPSESVQTLF